MIKPLESRVLIKMKEGEETKRWELYYQVEHKKNHK